MKQFAVMDVDDPTIVGNIVLAPDKETAEFATSRTCIEYTEENPAIIGRRYLDGRFEGPADEPWMPPENPKQYLTEG